MHGHLHIIKVLLTPYVSILMGIDEAIAVLQCKSYLSWPWASLHYTSCHLLYFTQIPQIATAMCDLIGWKILVGTSRWFYYYVYLQKGHETSIGLT